MATYTVTEGTTAQPLAWTEVDATILSITAGTVILDNSDDTFTVLIGSGFAGTTGRRVR